MPDADRKILVVDDDPDLLALVELVLDAAGFDVGTATDGREGLDAVRRAMPDLILLDMRMPVMNGWEFADQFHARYGTRTPIVVLTAAEDARRRAEEIGAVGWVGKPFDVDHLVGVVKRHLGNSTH